MTESLPESPLPLPPAPPVRALAAPLTRRQKIVRVLIGFTGWYLVNGLFWLLVLQLTPAKINRSDVEFTAVIGWAITLAVFNALALLFAAMIRPTRWIALGMLAAIALNFILSLILDLWFNALCMMPFYIQ